MVKLSDSTVLVVGAGVSGLTCAIRFLEAGANVEIVTASAPAGTTSAVAGAGLGPVIGMSGSPDLEDAVSSGSRSLTWEKRSDEVFRTLADNERTGVRLMLGRLLSTAESGLTPPPWAVDVPGYRPCRAGEIPADFAVGFWAKFPVADMPVYLAWLVRRVVELGGRITLGIVTDLATAAGTTLRQPDIVVNCAGLGAMSLASDSTLQPAWGQHVIVDAPEIQNFVIGMRADSDLVIIFPHPRGVLLGGVRREGRNDLAPDFDVAAETIERSAQVEPSLATAPIVAVEVGLRPGRPTVRLEVEDRAGTTVVHNYGHDSFGVFWSWGCADEAVALCAD